MGMIEIMVHVDSPAGEKLAGAIMAMGTKKETTTETTTEEPHLSAPQALPPSPKGEGLKAPETKAEEAEETPAQPEAPEEAAEAACVTLDQVQRAAAFLRDQGKLKAVTEMFGEFGIRKLSDLEGDKLQAFAGRLRGLGAEL